MVKYTASNSTCNSYGFTCFYNVSIHVVEHNIVLLFVKFILLCNHMPMMEFYFAILCHMMNRIIRNAQFWLESINSHSFLCFEHWFKRLKITKYFFSLFPDDLTGQSNLFSSKIPSFGHFKYSSTNWKQNMYMYGTVNKNNL